MITFSDLELVTTLCDSGSLSEAARKLRVTTAALSMRLRKLEAQLGLKLASRDARRLVLTEEGERMAEEGRRLLRSLEELSDSMVADDERLQGVIPPLGAVWLWPVAHCSVAGPVCQTAPQAAG